MFDSKFHIKLKKGNPDAFQELYKALYPRLKGYCSLFISDMDRVNDIIQDCIIDLWEKRNRINPDKSIEGLLFTMVRNRCLNFLKEKRFSGSRVDVDQIQINELQYLYQLDLSERIEKSLEEQLIESLQKAIDDLPPKMKYVFTKCKIEENNQNEIANELGISQRMVEKHISKAKYRKYEKLLKQFPSLVLVISLLIK